MSTSRLAPALPSTPHVLVVMVATGRPHHLVSAVRTLRAQSYPLMDVVAVDDTGNADVYQDLSARLGRDRVLKTDRRVGFARAANMALRDDMVAGTGMKDANVVLLMDADVALAPDAVAWMVRHLQANPEVAIVGPKIRAWAEQPVLRSFELSADFLGHAEGGIEAGELDQGQYDDRDEALWVDGACLAVRIDVWKAIGGFDSRYDHHREDFDLCWRARILGYQVGLVHQAVAYAADRDEDVVTRRYLTTRNTLTTRWKNMPTGRLVWSALPSLLVVLATLAWLLLTRRFGQAGALVRGWGWALSQLGGARRRRATIQRLRTTSEREIDPLRAKGLPRLNRALWALTETVITEDQTENDESWSLTDPLADQPFQRFLRDQSLIIIGLPMLLALIFSTAAFWNDLPISGGQVAPWVDGRTWIDGLFSTRPLAPIGQASQSSPTAWALASLAWLLPLPAWLVQRVALFSLPVVAWIGTMFLGRHLTIRPAPRVFAAAVVASSPLLLGALGAGDLSGAIVLVLAPGLASATLGLSTPHQPARAWRATAYWAFIAAIVIGAGPLTALWVLIPLIVLAVVRSMRPHTRMGLVRTLTAAVLGFGLGTPWLITWVRTAGQLDSLRADDLVASDFFAAFTGRVGDQSVDITASGVELAHQLLPLVIPFTLVLVAFTIGLRRNRILGGVSALAMVLGALALYFAGYAPPHIPLGIGVGGLWLLGVAGLVILLVTWTTWEEGTRTHTSAWGMLLSTLLVVGIGYQGFQLANGPYTQLRTDELVPAFVASETAQVGPQRVIRLGRDLDGRLNWGVTMATGPAISAYGQFDDPTVVTAINNALPSAVSQIGSNAGNVLGLLGVRWIVLDGSDEALTTALSAQPWLDRVPSTAAAVYRVATWQPFVSIPDQSLASTIRAGAALPALTEAETPAVLRPTRTLQGWTIPVPPGAGDLLLLAQGGDSQWEATADGQPLQPVTNSNATLAMIHAWTLPEGARSVQITAVQTPLDRLFLALQGVILLIIVSLALRPPGRHAQDRRIDQGDLPDDLTAITDSTGPIPVVTGGVPPAGEWVTPHRHGRPRSCAPC